MKNKNCVGCGVLFVRRWQKKFCSNRCQMLWQYKVYIGNWKKGENQGNIGVTARNISVHLRRYLIEKANYKCSLCGWDKKNPISNKVSLEIDHIDGNSENNHEENLRVLCPNCHSLTPYFKNLNRGNGRKWRTDKYIKN